MQPLFVAADVSGQPVGPIFKGQRVFDPRRWDLHAVPKRRYLSANQCCVTSQKNEGLVLQYVRI